MTITNRILLQIATAAGVVIVTASTATYKLVYHTAEQQGLDHLSDYVAERARVEEVKFAHIQENLEMVRGQFIQKISPPVAQNYQEQWNVFFQKYPDGAWRSRTNYVDGRKWSTLWLRKDAVLTPELQTQILAANSIGNSLIRGWVDSFVSLYFVFPCNANIGFDPRIPNWVWDTPANYDNNAIEAVRSANPKNNPSRQIVWNSVLEEPTSHLPYISVMLPIDVNGTNIATIGHDIHALQMLDDSTRSRLEGVTHFIFRQDGRLIAHREKMPEILKSNGHLTMQESGDPVLRSLYSSVMKQHAQLFSGYEPISRSYYAVARLAGPDWFFITTMPGTRLQQQAFQSARWVLWSGLISLALVLAFFAFILRRQIARPLAELIRATYGVGGGDTTVRARLAHRDELGELAASFNRMAGRVAQRDAELRAINQSLEARVEERTKKLQESEARFSKAFQASPAMMAITRLSDGTFIAANEAFYQIAGFTQAEVIGRRALELNIYSIPQEREDYVKLIHTHGFVRDREHSLRTKDGSTRTVLLSGELVELEGQPHLLTVGLDITGRKQAEVETIKALAREKELSELKTNFVSMVSHEFRTPLGVIQSASDVLDRYLDRLPPDKRRKHLDMIFRSTKNLSQLVDGVLLLGKVEDGRMQFTPVPIDLAATCAQLVDEVHSATARSSPIDFTAGPGLEGARSDADLLRHIFTNLLSNAVKYSPPRSPVQFSLERREGNAIFTMRDHGIGISEEDQQNLFKSFARGRNVGSRPGTGLGLVIVQRCVELHGGTIQMHSRLDEGSTVIVTLPVFSEA